MHKEKEYLLENLSILVSSGMGILSSLDSIDSDIKSRKMHKIIKKIKEDIESGSSLWKTLEKSKIFSGQIISLIKIGEESGRLSENLKVLSMQQQKERSFRSKISSAMIYPVFVFFLSIILGLGISWFILPKLAAVFSQLKIDLPLITKIIIIAGIFLGKYGMIFVPSVIIFIVASVYFGFIFSKTKFIGEYLLFKMPPTKRVLREIELGRMGYILGTLLKSGLPIVASIGSLKSVSGLRIYKKFYEFLEKNIEDGNSFQKSFQDYKKSKKLIPISIQQIIVAGEKSGNLSGALIKIGEIFEEKTENTAKNLTAILEPILLVFVWTGVMAIALAVILPIYNLIGGLK